MASSTAATWDKLPDALMLRIFNFVPVDTRLLCLLVCRYWCTLLGLTEAWTRLDLSVLNRKTRSAASNEAIFRGFVAKGAGKIVSLSLLAQVQAILQARRKADTSKKNKKAQ
jgi:F-box-like